MVVCSLGRAMAARLMLLAGVCALAGCQANRVTVYDWFSPWAAFRSSAGGSSPDGPASDIEPALPPAPGVFDGSSARNVVADPTEPRLAEASSPDSTVPFENETVELTIRSTESPAGESPALPSAADDSGPMLVRTSAKGLREPITLLLPEFDTEPSHPADLAAWDANAADLRGLFDGPGDELRPLPTANPNPAPLPLIIPAAAPGPSRERMLQLWPANPWAPPQ